MSIEQRKKPIVKGEDARRFLKNEKIVDEKLKTLTFEKLLQAIAKYESSLYSCAIEGNEFANKHIGKIKNMDLVEKYLYLKDVFDELEKKYN